MNYAGLSNTVYWEDDGMINASAGSMVLTSGLIPELQTLKSTTIEAVVYCLNNGAELGGDVIGFTNAGYTPFSNLTISIEPGTVLLAGCYDQGGTCFPQKLQIEKNKKMHIAIVSEEYQNGTGNVRLYINGQEYSSTPRKGENFAIQDASANYLTIFNFYPYCDYTNSFVGKIFSTRVYGDALTPEEIKQNYNTDKTRYGI